MLELFFPLLKLSGRERYTGIPHYTQQCGTIKITIQAETAFDLINNGKHYDCPVTYKYFLNFKNSHQLQIYREIF